MLRLRNRVLLLPASILCGLLIAPPPRATPGGPDKPRPAGTPGPLVERAVSELILIETYVNDSRGRPLAGLTADDFVLIVDGHKSPIASFEYRTIGLPLAGAETADRTTIPGQAVRAAGLPRRFMLFFEDGASQPAGLTAARRAAQRFLATGLEPSDQVGIAAYDMDLRILRDFTTDREALRRTIDQSLHEARRLSDFAAEQQKHDEEIGRLLTEIKQMGEVRELGGRARSSATPQEKSRSGRPFPPAAAALVKQARMLAASYGLEEAPRLRGVLRALRTLTDSIAAWGGYKAIIYMGDGLSENPALPYVQRVLAVVQDDGVFSRVAQSSLASDLQELLQAAAAAGVTIDTLQTRGLEAGSAREMEAARRRSNSLESIALASGGLSSSSNDFLKALHDFEADSRGYYILGYVPGGPADGRLHSVQVQCRKRDARRVRCRRGFVRLDPKEAHERAILAAYTVPEMYPQMDIGLSAVAGPASPSGRVMDLVVHVPGDRILFRPEAGKPTAHLEVGVVALDVARKETVQSSRALTISLSPEHGRPGEVGVNLVDRVRLPAGTQSITAVVYDDAAGLVGGTRLTLAPDTSSMSHVLGLSIYSLSDKSVWIEVPEGPAHGAADPSMEYRIGPALKAGYAPGEPLVCGFRMPERTVGGTGFRIAIRQGDNLLKTVGVEAPAAGSDGKVHVPLPVDEFLTGEYTVVVQEILPAGPVDRGIAALSIRPAEAAPTVPAEAPEP